MVGWSKTTVKSHVRRHLQALRMEAMTRDDRGAACPIKPSFGGTFVSEA
tara:strand:+ start:305 stop:451 length:147 start_codon:yes stop_codon:yes gene_type:complete